MSLTYTNNRWELIPEKTDYKTDHKTDYDTNPDTVLESYQSWEKTSCKYRAFGKCLKHNRGWVTRYRTDWARIQQNEIMNRENRETNAENTTTNAKNVKRNTAYDSTISTANQTMAGTYTNNRQQIRNLDVDDEAKNALQNQFKNFYRAEKLQIWDSDLAAPIPGLEGSTFNGDYYRGVSEAGNQWTEAVNDDDIDITERYGDSDTYSLQHWSNTGRHAGLRAYAPSVTEAATNYTESVTDADKQDVKDRQLGINREQTQTERLMNIDYIANEYDRARRGDPYWKQLAREKFLDPEDPDQFVALFRMSEREEDLDVAFINQINNPSFVGISELEDAINEAVGDRATVDVEKFAALTQNVLKDTIEEMKKAKGQEEFLATISGFSGFSEIMDVNKTLTNTILGDSGVGGYLNMISAGKSEEDLEQALGNVTGIGNNVKYNWQKWFDEKLVEKYGIDYQRFLPLEEKQDIINAFKNTNLEVNPYDENTNKFSEEFLDLAGYKTSESLVSFLEEQGDQGSNILNIIKGDLDGASALDPILTSINEDIRVIDAERDRGLELEYTTGDIDDPETEIDESKKMLRIEASFARDFVDNYLTERFDTSRSMDEFTEYLSIRQEEQNPFQTQDMLNAVQQTAEINAQSFLDAIDTTIEQRFDSDWYMDPTVVENVGKTERYEEQKNRVNADWINAKTNPDVLIDASLPSLGTWKQQLYRFGIDPENKDQFARMHFQIVGQGQGYDPAEDLLNPSKVKDHIYENILPNLSDEALSQGTIFGNFITPEEFAEDLLRGLDPQDKNTWEEVLQRYGLEGFKGTVEDLKEYVIETLRTGSAHEIREHIKYLNEKRQKPTQEKLGISYIEREEDYKDEMAKSDTQLYKTFQSAGFQGTEDEFYEDFFPDLDRSEQKLLTKGGQDDPLETYGLDMSDPFASLGTISSFLDDEEEDEDEDEEKDKDSGTSYFDLDLDDKEEWDYKPKKDQEVLDEFTTLFKGL